MCDILNLFDLNKFQQKIFLSTEHCLLHANKHDVNDGDIIFTIGIPHEYLITWYDIKHRGKLCEYSFNEILNAFISQHGIQLNESERIHGVLRRCCGEISNKHRKLKGRSKAAYLGFIKKLSVYSYDIVKVAEAQKIVADTNKEVELLSTENKKLNERCEELLTKVGSLAERQKLTNEALDKKQKDLDTLLSENKALGEYLKKVGFYPSFKNTGKGISELGKKQKHRMLSHVTICVEQSLWFAETFGLTLKSATFSDKDFLRMVIYTGFLYVLYFQVKFRYQYKTTPEL